MKNELWAYKVDIRNLARNTVGNLKIEYRIFVKNEAKGAFIDDDLGGFHAGEQQVPASLRYNESTSFTTIGVPIDSVNYNSTTTRNRHQDALRGLMLRIKDGAGKVVHHYVSPITTLQGKTWDSIPASRQVKTQ